MRATDRAQRPERIAILPLRNSVLFPMSVVPINVGRPRSVRLVEDLSGSDRALVGVITQRNADTPEPTFEDLYTVGTLARVVKVIRLGPSNYSVVLNGLGRFKLLAPHGHEPYLRAEVERVVEHTAPTEATAALGQRLRERTREVLSLMPNLPKETASILDNVREPGALADLIASNFPEEHAGITVRQGILEAFDTEQRVGLVLAMVERQLEILKVKDRISSVVQSEMSKSQREYVLRQQAKTIREELGEGGDDDEIEALRERIARAELPKEAERAAKKQLGRLSSMQQQSAEYQVTRTYVEWLADLPWNRTTPDRLDVKDVRRCLDEDHYGLERVKRRIVEFSAIRQLRRDKKGPILLFVGPPGVGKTSLGRSIARSMGRRYGRISLGGVRDEAEIRGHRRTYVGALPGRVIQALKKVGCRNPVLVLDEVDKMGVDLRGDPAAALLEVLDPEQNDSFVDHYIDLPFDLSEVMFLATANYGWQIPDALKDRMELIEVPGYTRTEKRAIAQQFLVPKQLKEHGLTTDQLAFEQDGIELLIESYTREAGVRNLEREIAAVCRDVTVKLAEGTEVKSRKANAEVVRELLGPERHRPEIAERKLVPGISVGLAVSSSGGDLLIIEATKMPGKGEIVITGSMRSVMKEAAETAVTLVRSKAQALGLQPEWLKAIDLHVHAPRGGAARDAPSIGLPIFVAVASLLLRAPCRSDVAVTGEITLRGAVLPVSGIKDQVLAAHRAGVRRVVMPARNAVDLEEVPVEVRDDLEVHLVSRIDQVLALVLSDPEPAPDDDRADSLLENEAAV
jgi:ATP-dependent Lon protease